MNGPAKCASGAGAGSAATEPRSRVSSGLGAPAPFHSESRPQRSAAEWRTRVAGWRSEHVWHDERSRRRSICLPPARTPSAVVPGTSSGSMRIPRRHPAIGIAEEIAGREATGDWNGEPGPKASPKLPSPDNAPRRLPGGTQPLPDIGQPQSGCERDETFRHLTDAAAVMDAAGASRVFVEVYDEIPATGAQRIVEREDVADMVAVLVDEGFVGGDAAEADATHDALASVGRASRSARTSDAQAAARASTSPWHLCSG